MDCGALEDVLRGARAEVVLVLLFKFSFIFLSVDAPMCLFFPASRTLIHAGTPARLASGNVCCLSEGKKVAYKRLKLAE